MLSATDGPVDVTVSSRAALAGFLTHAVTSRRSEPDPARQAGRYVLCMRHTAYSFELDDDRPGRPRRSVGLSLTGGVLGALAEPRRPGTPAGFRLARGGWLRDRFRPDGYASPGAVSDGVAYAYLADVFVVAGARGRGLAPRSLKP